MNKNQNQTVMEIMNGLPGVCLRERHGSRFRFPMRMTRSMSDAPLEALDLGMRASNSLKRAGYHTVGDVTGAISSGMELSSIRNCGKTSIREIMEHLFLFQYNSLPANRREDYLREVVILNLEYGAGNEAAHAAGL